MAGFKFVEKEEAEESDTELDIQDIQEEGPKQYDEHFWCKSKGVPVGFTYKSKKQDFIRASEDIKSNFQILAKGGPKQMENLEFRVLDDRKKDNGSEMDIEITKNKERGVAVLKFYGPNSKTGECTLMISKSKRYNVKFVRILAVEVIKKMVDTFISGEGWNSIFKKTTQNDRKQFNCNTCKKTFINEKNVSDHKEKYHTKAKILCENCGYEATDQKTLNEHMKDHTVKEQCDEIKEVKGKGNSCNKQSDINCNMCEFTTREKSTLEEHQRSHNKKEYVCGNCEFTTEIRSKIKVHIKDTHTEKEEPKLLSEEPEDMEIDEASDKTEIVNKNKEYISEKEERKRRSQMQDRKIIENQRKRDQEEHRLKLEKEETGRKKMEDEKEKQQEERIERRKRKASIKQQKKKIKRKLNKYPPNVTELPENVKHLVNEGDLQLQVPPDGACGPNAGAAHLFKDPKYGPNFRIQMNNFLADRWHFYKNKIVFPYVRKIGVNGDYVRFEIGEEEKFRQFLRTKRAAFLWTDSEDLHVMANMYQMQIRVITTKGPQDSHPTVNMVGPDSELNNFKLLPEGAVSDMTLLHYDELHYNLVISKDDDIAKFGTLSDYLTNKETEKVVDEGFKETENVILEESKLSEAYEKSKITIEKLNQRVKELENELQEKSVELQEAIETIEHAHEFETVRSKKNEERPKFICTKCNSKFKNQTLLSNHMKLSHISEMEFNCVDCSFKGNNDKELRNHLTSLHTSQSLMKEFKECQESKRNIEKEYFQCEQELRNKTEEVEKFKIEVKDLRTIVDLRRQLDQRDNEIRDWNDDTKNLTLNNSSGVNSKQGKSITCTKCEYIVENKMQLRRHMNTKHSGNYLEKKMESDEEFNCEDCDFQTTSAAHLKKHFDLKHIIKCKICEKEFKDKSNLMKHRKKEHSYSVAPCRKFAQSNCPFIEETCFWRHTVEDNSTEHIQCYVCAKTFITKTELMKHRKKEHPSIVKECSKHQEGKCGYQEEFCWFIHSMKEVQNEKKTNKFDNKMEIDGEDKDEVSNSVFYQAQKKPKPPLGDEK